jgi:type II secretory ATPase GspE/PulE/Tfp pilus assembly ATPase PilB-like protein
VLPAVHGESVVVRLLDTNESLWNLEQFGLTPITQAAVRLAHEGKISLSEAWRARAD